MKCAGISLLCWVWSSRSEAQQSLKRMGLYAPAAIRSLSVSSNNPAVMSAKPAAYLDDSPNNNHSPGLEYLQGRDCLFFQTKIQGAK